MNNITTFDEHFEHRYGKLGTKKSFISRIENGHSDIQLSTLYRLIEIRFNQKFTQRKYGYTH